MAEGILRQSYDSTGTKVFPLTVIDGILQKTDVNVMDPLNRGAYAIIDSMLHHDVDFDKQTLTKLYVYERTWNTDSSEYNADASIVLSVDKDGLEVKSGKYTKLSGEVSAYSTVNEGGDVLFGKYNPDKTSFTKYGMNTVVGNVGETSYGRVELYRNNEQLYFSIGDGELKFVDTNGPSTNGLTMNYSQIKYTGSITSNGNIIIGGDASIYGKLYVEKDASINKTLKVGEDSSLYGKLHVAKDVSINKTLNVGEDSSLYGKLYVAKDVSINKTLKVGEDTSIYGRLYVKKDASIDSNLKIGGDSSLYGKLYVHKGIYAPNGDASYMHHMITAGNELNLAGNMNTSGELYFNYRSGNEVNMIKMMRGTKTNTEGGGLSNLSAKNLQLGGNYSYYTDTSLVLATNGTGKPSIVFERGTSGDTNTDFRIIDDSGYLMMQYKYGTGDSSVYGYKTTPLVIDSNNGGTVRPGNTTPGVKLGTTVYPWSHGYFRDAVYAGTSNFHDGYYTQLDWNSISAWKSGVKSDLLIQYNGGNTDVRGLMITRNVEPNSGSTYNIGNSTNRYNSIYADKIYLSDEWAAQYNENHFADPYSSGMDPVIGGNKGGWFDPSNVELKYRVNGTEKTITFSSDGERKNKINEFLSKKYGGFCLGNKSETSEGTTSDNLIVRLTVPEGGYPYMLLRRIAIYVCRYSWNLQVRIRTMNKKSSTYVDRGTYNLYGWSGWNTIPVGGVDGWSFGGSDDQTGNIKKIEFEFFAYSINGTTKTVPKIYALHLLGTEIWSTGGKNMPLSGHIYDWDWNENAYFPKNVVPRDHIVFPKNTAGSYFHDIYVNGSGQTEEHGGGSGSKLNIHTETLHIIDNTRVRINNIEYFQSQDLDFNNNEYRWYDGSGAKGYYLRTKKLVTSDSSSKSYYHKDVIICLPYSDGWRGGDIISVYIDGTSIGSNRFYVPKNSRWGSGYHKDWFKLETIGKGWHVLMITNGNSTTRAASRSDSTDSGYSTPATMAVTVLH